VFSFFGLVGTILVTLYMAMMYNNESIMLLVFLEAALFVVALITIIIRRMTLNVHLEVPIGISETGKQNLVKILINNSLPVSVSRMKAFIVVKNTITGKMKKSWMKLAQTYDEETSLVQNIVFDTAGNYELMLKKIRVYDMTGLLYWDVKNGSSRKIQVMPKLHDVVVNLGAHIKNFYGESDEYDEHKPGHDNSQIYDVREYRVGDRLQNVHWKMTAKQDELMVKEPSMPKACPVVLCLEHDGSKSLGKGNKNIKFAEVAASLSFSMMDADCSHYVVWYDEYKRDIVRVRVDNEESMFYFLGKLMDVKWVKTEENITTLYMDKYRAEKYVCMLSLSNELVIKRDDEIVAKLSHKKLEESLSQVELIL